MIARDCWNFVASYAAFSIELAEPMKTGERSFEEELASLSSAQARQMTNEVRPEALRVVSSATVYFGLSKVG